MMVDQNWGHRHSNPHSHTASGVQSRNGIRAMRHTVGPSASAERHGCNRCDVVNTQECDTHLQTVASRAFPPSISTFVVSLEEANNANLVLAPSVLNETHHVRHRPLIGKTQCHQEWVSACHAPESCNISEENFDLQTLFAR